MLLGILSDSHGRAARTGDAVFALRRRGAELLVHLGDFESETVIDELVGHPARVVFGNCDWSAAAMADYARHVGVGVDHPLGVIEADGRRIAFTHGHLPRLMEQAIRDGVDYLLHGHTHEVRDERIGNTRIINPGALHRARRYTVALLDTAADRLELIEIAPATAPGSHGSA
jgi:uncharacterized protein